MYKIAFFAPETHVEEIKTAMFQQGAGRIGDYQYCAWQVLGEGQFMPLKNAKPFLGEKGQLTRVPEYYVEMVCSEDVIQKVIAAMKSAHPYEEPAYQVVKLEAF
jgi:structural toxin protein (hemagglutinin/hemolysin) RtxA